MQLQTEYPHPIQQVWRALTEPNLMGQWIMNFPGKGWTEEGMKTDFRPVVGATYRMDAEPKGWRGYVVGEVLEVVPKKRLVYTWAHSPYQDANPARIEFTLDPTAKGTHLRMVQTGFPGFKGWFVLKMAKMGWKKMLSEGVPFVLDRAASQVAR